jgi:hydroxypyruvate reductase
MTRYGHAVPATETEVIEASPPVPDGAGETAAQRIVESVRGRALLVSGQGETIKPGDQRPPASGSEGVNRD